MSMRRRALPLALGQPGRSWAAAEGCARRRGFSQRQLAFPGCSSAYISRLEAGQRVAALQLLRKIAAKLAVDEEFLATGIPREQAFPSDLVEADVALRLDDLETARELYEPALKTSAEPRAEALGGLGRLALLQGDPSQAVDSIRKRYDWRPRSRPPHQG